jgi:aminopeptidase N
MLTSARLVEYGGVLMKQQPKTTYLKDYQPFAFEVEKVYLHVDLFDKNALVKAILHCRRNPTATDPNAALRLDGEELALQAVVLDGKPLQASAYKVDENSLTLSGLPDAFVLETVVEIKPQHNKSLMGLYRSGGNFCTQCEAEGFRRITYFPDRPDVMTRFTTSISADKEHYPFLLSNGNLLEEKMLADNRHWALWEDPSLKPCYLFALVAGNFDLLQDSYTTCTGREVMLRLYVEKGFLDQSEHAMQSLKKAMQWDEQRYGREYDLAIYMIVAVSDFNMGAMENKGLNIFNTRYVLAKPTTATDRDFIGIENVIGHEYFHNWSGNRITCRDWFQLTLKEGLTVFRDQCFIEDMTSAVARIDSVNVLRNKQFLEDASAMAHPIRPDSYIEINNFYTSTVYNKGAEVIRMVRTLIGEECFHRAMDLYFQRYDGQAVTTEDFIAVMAETSGRDLIQFQRWYHQAGTPVLTIKSDYDAINKTYTLVVKQGCDKVDEVAHKKPFHIPLAIGFLSDDCLELATQLPNESSAQIGTRVLEIVEQEQRFDFVNVETKPILSLLRGFSAPVKLHYEYTDQQLFSLFLCDTDGFSRYEAGQLYIKRVVMQLLRQYQESGKLTMNDSLVDVYRELLKNPRADRQYLARLLTLPSFIDLIQDHAGLDIAALQTVFAFIVSSLGKELSTEWLEYYQQQQLSHYSFNMEDVGKRAIKNLALYYLCATGNNDYYDLAYQQLLRSDNMTDQMGALMALNDRDCKQRNQGLEKFYQQWREQPLVVNKWLACHAGAYLATTLATVKATMQHCAFDLNNPNNVYALLGGFANNIPCFHELGGSGYQFVAEQVIAINAQNPQVAARILLPLTQWQQFDQQRQVLMRDALKQIAKSKNLSSDVYELVTKSF